MVILAIESTAHTLSMALLSPEGTVLSEARSQLQTEAGGLIPIKIQEHHLQHAERLLTHIFTHARVSPQMITLIALSTAPGIGHALRVGEILATHLAFRLHIPILPVHHGMAHLTSALLLTTSKNVVLLYTSGANTQLYTYHQGMLTLVGETLDMSLGNMLDSVARLLQLGFPGGPALERLAQQGKILHPLPYTIKGMDVSYGGFYTAVKRLLQQNAAPADVAFSVQEYAFALILEAAERAMALHQADTLALIGGVALNTRFAHMAHTLCTQRNARLLIPPSHLLGDNSIMIGLEALRQWQCDHVQPIPPDELHAQIQPYARIPKRHIYQRCFTLKEEDLTISE